MVVKITCSRSPGTAALPSAMYDFNCVKTESQCFNIEAMSTKLWSAIGFGDWICDTSNQHVGPGFCHLEWAHGGLHLCHVCCPDHVDVLEARVVSSGLDLCEVTVHVRIAD